MISDQVTIENVTNERLQNHLIGSLTKKYNIDLHSVTVDQIELSARKGSKKTTINIKRSQHRPFLINLRVDHRHHKSVGKYNQFRRSNTSQSGDRGGFFKYYFYWIIISIVGTIFYFILDFFFPTSTTKIGFLGSIIIVVLLYFTFRRPMGKIFERVLDKFDIMVFEDVKYTLSLLSTGDVKVQNKKCWNCFKEVDHSKGVCDFCEANLA